MISALIFDMDGVITKTAIVHGAAWKEMFDDFLCKRCEQTGERFRPFTHEGDYLPYVDGKPRLKGIESFLESRGISLALGTENDSPEEETICALGKRKNKAFVHVIETQGVELYDSTIALIREARDSGIHIAVGSSSKNCQQVLQAAGVEDLFETRVDGNTLDELGLNGKPEADMFIQAAKNLGTDVKQSVVIEDAISGVQAGRNGGFGLVIGLAREDNEDDLKSNGADIVLNDFEGYGLKDVKQWFATKNNV